VARMGDIRSANSVFVEKSAGKSPLGRPRLRWDDIKMDLKLDGYVCVLYPSQEKDQSQVQLHVVVEMEENFLTSEVGSLGLSRSTLHHGVSLNVHQDCSSLPDDCTLETQLSHLRRLGVMTSCSPLKP
jgi:hypothetical protein